MQVITGIPHRQRPAVKNIFTPIAHAQAAAFREGLCVRRFFGCFAFIGHRGDNLLRRLGFRLILCRALRWLHLACVRYGFHRYAILGERQRRQCTGCQRKAKPQGRNPPDKASFFLLHHVPHFPLFARAGKQVHNIIISR